MKLYFLEFILTTKCNQQCDYCNVFNINPEITKLEVDIDFLRYILKLIPNNSVIEFCGGEPGLLSNLDDVFDITVSNPKVRIVQVMSNGLVRLKGYDWLKNKNVWYFEHLIKDIDGLKVEKFYDSIDYVKFPRWRYVVVTTQKTVRSLLSHFDHYRSLGMFDDIFWYKIMNQKVMGVESFIFELKMFFELLKGECDDNYIIDSLRKINGIIFPTANNTAMKYMCGLNSPQPTVNFETKELFHCGAFLGPSRRYPFTEENFIKHLHCDLFVDREHYCENCYIYKDNVVQSIISCRNGDFYNLLVKGIDK
jgi:MoaA/NifB/PqqE/SkfB family radical SAM enzyme